MGKEREKGTISWYVKHPYTNDDSEKGYDGIEANETLQIIQETQNRVRFIIWVYYRANQEEGRKQIIACRSGEEGEMPADDSMLLSHSSSNYPSTCLGKFEEHFWKFFKSVLYFLDWKGHTRTRDRLLDLPFTAREKTEEVLAVAGGDECACCNECALTSANLALLIEKKNIYI